MNVENLNCEVVVIGGGGSGLIVAVRAVETGAKSDCSGKRRASWWQCHAGSGFIRHKQSYFTASGQGCFH